MAKNGWSIISAKDYYSLLLEYLKRSESYAEFCDYLELVGFDYDKLEEKFPMIKAWDYPFPYIYNWWGDVRDEEIEIRFNARWRLFQGLDKLHYINDYTKTFEIDFFFAFDNYKYAIKKEFKKAKISLNFLGGEKHRKLLLETFQRTISKSHNRILLEIKLPITKTLPEIKADVVRYLSNELKRKLKKEKWYKFYFFRTGADVRIRKSEIERYLKIYDLKKQGMTWRQIASEIDEYKNRSYNKDLENRLRKEKNKALRIIKNIEKGEFPGKY